MPAPTNSGGPSLLVLEAGLTLITVAVAFCVPELGATFFSKLERLLGAVARKRGLSVLLVGTSACLLRLLILPLSPIPKPFIHDEFSLLLAADTFASGRLTNPTHPMWVHFETVHVTQKPTYMSMYFPAQGMVLAAGKVLAGHPWYGVLASCGIMCAAICWMLQGWMPPGWALLGGMLAVVRLALFSYWINEYWGGAAAAIGGALVLGAVPRLKRQFRACDFFWLAVGMGILANIRPFEGLLVSIPALVVLCWYLTKKPHPRPAALLRRVAPATGVLLFTAAFIGYYNYRVFGNVLTPSYAVNRATYASAPHFWLQSARPEPVYRHEIMREFYSDVELAWFRKMRTAKGFFEANANKLGFALLFYPGITMLPALVMLPRAFRDRRVRFLVVTGLVVVIGIGLETWFIPHYLAPFTAGVYAILVQCMRHLRFWRPGSRPMGLFLVRAIPVLCLALAGLRLYAQPLHLQLVGADCLTWYGTEPLGLERAQVAAKLESYPGRQLAIVRYARGHSVFDEWVYNAADIDKSKVVWAREMNPRDDQQLLRYFKSRKAWLVEPDCNPARVSRLPVNRETILARSPPL